jgi:UDP-N-acetylglucosamine 4-epimerase
MDIHDKNFLVTGGAGFIGSAVSEYLLKNGAKIVRVIDNLATGSRKNLEPLEKYNNFEFMFGTITDYDFCLKATQDMNIVCHQAALASVPKSILEPDEYNNVNVTGFLNMLNAAKTNGIKRIVYASSSAVYGDNTDNVKVENRTGNQLSPYALTKYIDDLYANMYTRLYSMECIGLRYFNVFGPTQNPNGAYAAAIPKFLQQLKLNKSPTIYGDGLQTRDFTYIDNVVNANFIAMTTNNTNCFGESFNIGTGQQVQVLSVYDNIVDILNIDIKPIFAEKRVGDIEHSLANIDKAKELLGWSPTVSFIDGLNVTVKMFAY